MNSGPVHRSLVAIVVALVSIALVGGSASAAGRQNVARSLATASPPVIATIPLAAFPYSVAVDPTTNRAYILTSKAVPPYSVSVVDGASNQVIATIALPTSLFPPFTLGSGSSWTSVAVDPATNQVFVVGSEYVIPDEYTTYYWIELLRIDGTSNTVVASQITTGGSIGNIAVNPATHQLLLAVGGWSQSGYDLNRNVVYTIHAHALDFVDPSTLQIITQAGAGSSPGAIAAEVATNRAYLATTEGPLGQPKVPGLAVVNLASDAVATTVTLAAQPGSLAVNAKTSRVYADYASPTGGGAIAVVDGVASTVIGTVDLAGPGGLAVNVHANRVYAADGISSLWIVDGATDTVVTGVRVGKGPTAVAANPVTGRVYVANSIDNTISVIQDGP